MFIIKHTIIIFTILLILHACSSSENTTGMTGFYFRIGGTKYQIETVPSQFGQGYNVLAHREGNIIYLLAIDKEQDGEIDEVVAGNIDLEEANRIYHYGISYGERIGYVKKRFFERKYDTTDEMYEYTLKTYILALGPTFNRLTIKHKMRLRSEIVILDMDANGEIERIEKGIGDMEELRRQYRYVLEKGIKESKVEYKEGTYKVIP
ncbi:MAG: hypothetical protein A2V66_05750 [Ignavibacteria bacterium RBG_13_36_8]|nr:MAG: hypothetical protein A2V66_05750 [Ignavibacteria bacterium RBG_13_36_8]